MLHRQLGTRALLGIPWSGVSTCSGVNVTPGDGNSSSACYTLVRCKNLLRVLMLHRELGTRAVLDIPWPGVKTCSGVNVTPEVGNSSRAGYTLARCKNLLWC